MAGLAETRKFCVQSLRKAGKACDVPLIRDTAAREKVVEFAQAIQNSGGPADEKTAASRAYEAYVATWPAEDEDDQDEDDEEVEEVVVVGWRLRGKSFLLTYNWDFWGKAFPDGTPAATTVAELWGLWRAWKAKKKKEQKVEQSTSTLEASLKSLDAGKVHFHWKVNCADEFDEPNTECFAFHGVFPDARRTVVSAAAKQARGANVVEASNRGHFYCWAPKRGTLHRGTNYQPFGQGSEGYRVLGKWLDDLWTDDKLDHDNYEALSLRVRVGHSHRKRELELVLTGEKEALVKRKMAEVDVQLAKLRAPFRKFTAVRAWEDSFLTLNFRWRLLVLVADSDSGKSSFAESLFDKPCVVTVEDAQHLDLKDFDGEVNDGLVLDNVNSWAQLLSWRAILQGRNAKSKGGQSATNVYAYAQYLFGVPVVATIDLEAPDAHLADASHKDRSKWLLKNCVFVRASAGEVFYDSAKLPKEKVDNTFSLFAATLKRRRGL